MTLQRFLILVLASSFFVLSACDDGKTKDTEDKDPSDADNDGVPAAEDCDDNDPSVSTLSTWYTDADTDGYGALASPLTDCHQPAGTVADSTDCDDTNALLHPGATEVCDGLDNNCDGSTDGADAEGALTWYADHDADAYGDPETSAAACTQPKGMVADNTDCNDLNPRINPRADETCNELDDDCDDLIDNDPVDAPDWFPDTDLDSFGDSDSRGEPACEAPKGMVSNDGDCDDSDPGINPETEEIVGDGIDQDCSGGETCYSDYDRDGYGTTTTRLSADMDCLDLRESSVSTDCADTDADIYPGAPELCNDDDDDCDGDIDEEAVDMVAWHQDLDLDGYGDASVSEIACSASSGWVANGTDCDDSDSSVRGPTTWYADLDLDGYGDSSTSLSSCDEPDDYVNRGGDCDDSTDQANPGMSEICGDGIDNDCDDDGSDCPLTGSDTLSRAWATLQGESSDDFAGFGVGAAGDIDDDSLQDLLVGAYGVDSSAGAAYLVLGGTSGTSNLSSARAILLGENASDKAGWALTSLQDLDGDSRRDLLIGAPGQDSGGANAGAVYVVSGDIRGHQSLASAGFTLLGANARDESGSALAPAGDLNDDGWQDLLVGATGLDSGGSDSGGAWLVLGPVSSSNSLSSVGLLLSGESADDAAGSALAGARDINGDGLDDLVIGAPDQGLGNTGAAYVVYGPLLTDLDLADSDARILGESAGDQAGWSVAAGDIDGDGLADILVGAPYHDGVGSNSGSVYLFSGPLDGDLSVTLADSVMLGESSLDSAGCSVAIADLDADGPGDLAIGAFYESTSGSQAGAVYLMFGPVSGEIDLSRANARRYGINAGDHAGRNMASVGDSNGDTYEDVLLGAEGNDSSASAAGAAYLLIGGLGP